MAAILSDYPQETMRYVTDPRTGLASNPIPDEVTGKIWTGMPDPAHVKIACEQHYGPVRRAEEREKLLAKQLENRERFGSRNLARHGVLISFKEFEDRGGSRPIGFFEDQTNIPPGCKPLRKEGA